jgi:GntR family transcriptional regulator/MocR family aminotransferase
MRIKHLPLSIVLGQGSTIATQIANAMREAITERRVAPGDALPSSRDLAEQLGVARNTVLSAIALLTDDGLVESRPGGGTFVSVRTIVEARHRSSETNHFVLTPWARSLPDDTIIGGAIAPLDLRPGIPDLRAIPFDEWRRSAMRKLKTLRIQIGSYGAPEGDEELRVEIARYVSRSRSVVCEAKNVIVTSGAQQAFDLITRAFVYPGITVAVEEPGYQPAKWAFKAGGAELCGIAVDADGLDVSRLPEYARIVYVTPSHQYPLGATMSHQRRHDLLEWASKHNALIVEDDYDSEYRYTKSLLPALQASDDAERVIYVGTFSKNLMPGIRLGYLIVPEGLRTVFVKAKWLVDRHSDNMSQSVLAEFMSSGMFARHVMQMQKIYAERHAMLMQFREVLSAQGATLLPSYAGLHACLLLDRGQNETDLIAAAVAQGVGVYGLRKTFLSSSSSFPGLILGFGNLRTRQIEVAISRLLPLLGLTNSH